MRRSSLRLAVGPCPLLHRPGPTGIHALVEKPMAPTFEEAEAMASEAEEAGVVLSVGLFRRLLSSSRMARALLDSGFLGRPLSFSLCSGAFYGWPSMTLGNMRKEQAGGGVLMDIGAHVLDQLLFFLPGSGEVLEYRDNSLGGIESDCSLHLRIHHEGSAIDGQVELSRARKRPGPIRIECERGTIELSPASITGWRSGPVGWLWKTRLAT